MIRSGLFLVSLFFEVFFQIKNCFSSDKIRNWTYEYSMKECPYEIKDFTEFAIPELEDNKVKKLTFPSMLNESAQIFLEMPK